MSPKLQERRAAFPETTDEKGAKGGSGGAFLLLKDQHYSCLPLLAITKHYFSTRQSYHYPIIAQAIKLQGLSTCATGAICFSDSPL